MALPSTAATWCAVYTRYQYEKKTYNSFCSLGYDAYLPVRKVMKRWSDRMKWIEEPLFNNYVFVRVSYEDYPNVQRLDGVVSFVQQNGRPVRIKDAEMNSIYTIEAQCRDVEKEDYYMPGSRVMVIGGAFLGMEGLLVEKAGKTRLLIRFETLHTALSVEISRHHVEKIS